MNLKELRRSRNVTQVELSEAIKLSQAEISQIENEKIPMTIKSAKKIGEFFGLDWKMLID